MNGELVDWNDARIHVGSHGLHYGSGVFEGIRAYETDKGTAVFRLTEHLKRLDNSARLLGEGLLWVGAGSERHMAGLPPTELVRVSRAQPVDVAEDV